MASAAKSINVAPIGVETGPVAVPGAAEMFAAMIAGVGGDETSGEGAMPEAAPEEPADNPEMQIDASVLLPMLDQQRAATPAAKLVAVPVDAARPETVKVTGPKDGGESPVPIMPPLADAKPAPVEMTDPAPVMRPVATGKAAAVPVSDPARVMRPREDGKGAPVSNSDKAPVMRGIEGGKPAPAADPAPVMRPLAEAKAAQPAVADKAPVMRPIDSGKPVPGVAADPTPVMRPVDGGKPAAVKSGEPTPVMRPTDGSAPKATTPPSASFVAVDVQQPEVLEVAPKPAAPPQVKTADAKAAPPEVQVAAAEAQAAPVAAKARQARTAIPANIESRTETTGTTPVAATATETRAAVQPLHAAPSLAAPAGAPVQNVAAALSQQVLNMSGGDAWIDQIARDISQTAGKDGTMRFRLAPETLGELKVEITHSERGAHVRLNVSSEAAQQALAAAEHKLTAEARAQGVRIAETEIAFTGGQSRDASAFAREQGQQQAQANHQPRTPRGTTAHSFTSSAAAPEGRGRTDRYA